MDESLTMAESSTMDESSTMAEAESSNQNPEKIIEFQVTPAIKLKQSIESLNDNEFNPDNVGRVDVTEKGFEITVINSDTEAGGYLFFKSSGLINFHCIKPFVDKIINLNQASLILNDSTDDDSVTISYLDGSNHLTFILGSAPDTEKIVEFVQVDYQIEIFPDITFYCEAVVTCNILREMIQKLEKFGNDGKSQRVSVDITERLVSIFVGECKSPWIFQYETEKVVGTRGLLPGQRHHACFIMKHLEAVKKAVNLAPCLLMCFLSKPVDYVMMRFNLRELGDLVFLNKASRLLRNVDDLIRIAGSGAQDVAMQPVHKV